MKWFDVYIKQNVLFVEDKIFLFCYFGSTKKKKWFVKYNLNSKKKKQYTF